MPPPQESELNYSDLYAQTFSKTVTYIRFSQTVEECIGCMYDMTDEDAAFLKTYNQKRPAAPPLSDDDFERIMEVFEDTAHYKTPFASVDQTIVPYDDMVQGLQHLETSSRFSVMPHAKDLYEYWKSRRQAFGNRALHATLKFETHQESDEMDPYVCFRRREVRQTRKTRARDVQSVEKLKRLRQELEEGRQLISATCKREDNKLELLKVDRAIFEQRAHLKEHKKRLGIKTHDEDLINVKVRRAAPATWLVLTSRSSRNPKGSNYLPRDDSLLPCCRLMRHDRTDALSIVSFCCCRQEMSRRSASWLQMLRKRFRTTKSGTGTISISRRARCLQFGGRRLFRASDPP